MSKNRYINTKFWSDNWIADLDPVEKLLFLYLITNEKTNICGLYELPLKYMAVETGIDKEMIIKILKRFQKEKKIFHYNGWVAISNFIKHQNYKNEKIKKGIELCMSEIPCKILDKFISYGYSIYDSSITHICLPNNSNSNSNSNLNSNNKEFFQKEEYFNTLLDDFSKALNINPKKLEEEFNHFILYWTELSKSGKKVRWEMEKTFDVKRRLYTWLRNKKEWANKKTKGKELIW